MIKGEEKSAVYERIAAACQRGCKLPRAPKATATRTSSHPTERQEQVRLAKWLDTHIGELNWCHPANESKRSQRYGASLRAQGLKAGLPDVLIFAVPQEQPTARGVAIELKRAKPARSTVSSQQREWLWALVENGWIAVVAYGADDAIRILKGLGWG